MVAVALCWPFASLKAQDIHFSQFYNAPLSLNPALTGVSSADVRFIGNYRSQWNRANAPYTTFQGMYDTKFLPKRNRPYYFSGGLSFIYDEAGDARLNNINLNLAGSFTYALNRNNFLTVGIMGGGAQRSFQYDRLYFDEQFNGWYFDPGLPTGENFEPKPSKMFGDFGAGLNYHAQSSKSRSHLDIGGGFYHLNTPNQSFLADPDAQLPMRMSFYVLPNIQLTERLDWVLHGSAQFQGPYMEALGGTGLRIYLSTHRSKELALQLAGSYRFNWIGESVIPSVEVWYAQWRVGVSYDINISAFSVATLYYGGPEISIQYLITKVKPLEDFRICRLF
jgi:type IX secretion system PorP/SprF family membrane protein